MRAVAGLYVFNDTNPPPHATSYLRDTPIEEIFQRKRGGEKLVEILAFCIMPNHFHLLVRQLSDDSIPYFMMKYGTALGKFINIKYKRRGQLFENRYKAILVDNDAHFIHLPYYIHCNCLDLSHPKWRTRELKSPQAAIAKMDSYLWSSHLDYSGVTNFPSVIDKEFLFEFFGGVEKYKKSLVSWLRYMGPASVDGFALED